VSNTDLLSSDTAETSASNGTPRRRAGLSGMVLPELRELAGQLGITGITGMRKGDLIAAIKERQGGSAAPAATTTRESGRAASRRGDQTELPVSAPEERAPRSGKSSSAAVVADAAPAGSTNGNHPEGNGSAPARAAETAEAGAEAAPRTRRRRAAGRPAGSPEDSTATTTTAPRGAERGEGRTDNRAEGRSDNRSEGRSDNRSEGRSDNRAENRSEGRDNRSEGRDNRDSGDRRERNQAEGRTGARPQTDRPQGDRPGNRQSSNSGGSSSSSNAGNNFDDDDERGGRRGRRFRDRRRGRNGRPEGGGAGGAGSTDTEIREDDVLLPVGGILDVLENYAFVRTSGYLAGPNDVYVSLSLVRKYGLRRGDAITGVVRQPREGEAQRQKFNPLVRVDKINGLDPEQSRNRPEFTKLTPLYPNERLRLETESHILPTRVIDLVMPIGKGQRALVVSPPKAGKTMVLQAIANAITTNNPECHLMVVLVDERPEEVTDMQRSVKGEVIASTFDRPPSDHTTVAELSIERAKRLVEMGHDVVVLLDSITRLGRAYNLAAPASGRILSGGVDSTALYPPKRFLGAARNIENGGSLTIFATALVETGSTMDTVIFEEFKGTGNAELKLDRKIADKRVFPAVDVDQSSTRKEELLLSPDELAVTHKLRRVLHALDSQQAIDLLLDRLRKSRTNIEFLMQVAKTTPGAGGDD
jgi:transcription termination factor Rho